MQAFPYHYIKQLTYGFYRIEGLDVNYPVIARVGEEIFRRGQPVNRFWTFQLIDVISKIFDLNAFKTVLDIGSRDGFQSIEFRTWFPDARILAFEPHPTGIELVRHYTSGWNIEICPFACGAQNGMTNFFATPPTSNMGASSLLPVDMDNHRSASWVGDPIQVECRRLDNLCAEKKIEEIDILWADVQGAEMMVMSGLGDLIYKTKAIATEIGVSSLYQGSTQLEQLHGYLVEHDFVCVGAYCHDHIPLIDFIRLGSGELDLVYVNKRYING